MARTSMTQEKALAWLAVIAKRKNQAARMQRLADRLKEAGEGEEIDAEGIADCADAIARYNADITHISNKLVVAVTKASATTDVDQYVRSNLSVFPVK